MLHCAMVAILVIRWDCLYQSKSDVWGVSLPPWPILDIELNDSAFLNLHVTPMSPIKFQLNLTFFLGGDTIWRISKWQPSLEQANAKCLPSWWSSIRLTIQKQMWFEDFQDGCYDGHLGYQNGTTLVILNLHAAPKVFHQVFAPSKLQFGSR